MKKSWCVLTLVLCIATCTTAGCVERPAFTETPESTTGSLSRVTPPETFIPTPMTSATLARTRAPIPTPTITAMPTSTRTPAPTRTPTRVPQHRVVAFVSDWDGDDDIYLLNLETGELINLTGVAGTGGGSTDAGATDTGAPDVYGEDRDPIFLPDRRTLAFRSNASGSWAFYQIDLVTGARTLLDDATHTDAAYRGSLSWNDPGKGSHGYTGAYTYVYEAYRNENLDLYVRTETGIHRPLAQHPAGDYDPAWRPGTYQIAFTSWRDGKKDLYLVDADGSHLARLTTGPDDHETPAWHPDGRRLAYVHWQEGNANLWELDLDSGAERQLTAAPYPDRSPAYAPNGELFWTRYAPGEPFEAHDPYRPGRWRLWTRSDDAPERPVVLPAADMDVYTPAAGYTPWPQVAPASLVAPAPTPTRGSTELTELVELDLQVAGNHPRLQAGLAASYEAWRAEVAARSGHDVLGHVSDMFRPLGHSNHSYGHLSWHRAGRAVDLSFEWRDPPDGPNRLLVVRENLGSQTYWRLYLHCRDQDGSTGEPLTVAPWVFWFDLDRAQEPIAYAAGGRPGRVPEGYYVDLTRLAKRHGWRRIAAYEEEDFDWRWDSLGREFWHYQQVEELTWWQAMGQIYPVAILEQFYSWSVCVDELELDPAWVEAKGIPTPTPSPHAPSTP